MRKTIISDICAGLLLLLFVYTGLTKLADYSNFKSVLAQSPLIHSLASTIVWALPLTEFLIALLLFIPTTQRTGLYVSAGILTCFTLYLLYMIRFSPALPCSCGGVLKQMTWRQHVLFNIACILVAVTGIMSKRRMPGSQQIVISPTSIL